MPPFFSGYWRKSAAANWSDRRESLIPERSIVRRPEIEDASSLVVHGFSCHLVDRGTARGRAATAAAASRTCGSHRGGTFRRAVSPSWRDVGARRAGLYPGDDA